MTDKTQEKIDEVVEAVVEETPVIVNEEDDLTDDDDDKKKKSSEKTEDDDDKKAKEEDDLDEGVVTETFKLSAEDIDISEHLAAMFNGEELSESFKERVKNIFEVAVVTAVNEKLEDEMVSLEENFEAKISEKVSELEEKFEDYKKLYTEQTEEKISEWSDFVVENWISENKPVLENKMKAQISEDFVDGLRNLFIEHNIDLPDEQFSVVESYENDIKELEARVSELAEEVIRGKKETEVLIKEAVLLKAGEGLSELQKARLEVIAENVNFESEDDYKVKIEEIKESYFKDEVKTPEPFEGDSEEMTVKLEEKVEQPTVLSAAQIYASKIKQQNT